MTTVRKLLQKVLSGTGDSALRFDDVVRLLKALNFEERIRGDHHIFTHQDFVDILNLQPRGSQAKAYQVKQIRELIVRQRLASKVKEE